MVKFFKNFLNRLAYRSVDNHMRDVRDYVTSLDSDAQLSYLVALLSKYENEKMNNGQTDFGPLTKYIQNNIGESLKDGNSLDSQISYYLCVIHELIRMKIKIAADIKSNLTEDNRKFFP